MATALNCALCQPPELERLIRANPYENTRLFANDAERGTVQARVETLAQRTRLVGLPWHALKEGFYAEQGHARRRQD